jgi:hypothetical protein
MYNHLYPIRVARKPLTIEKDLIFLLGQVVSTNEWCDPFNFEKWALIILLVTYAIKQIMITLWFSASATCQCNFHMLELIDH